MGSELALLEARRMETAEQVSPCCMYTGCTLHIHCIHMHGGRAGEPVLHPLTVLRRHPLTWLHPLASPPAPYFAALPYQLLTMVASYKLLGEQLWTTQEQA